MKNKTNLDLSKYDLTSLPQLVVIKPYLNEKIVTFDKPFPNIKVGDILSEIGNEFNEVIVKLIIAENIFIVATKGDLSINGRYTYYKDVINTNDNSAKLYINSTLKNENLKEYLMDRIDELYPTYNIIPELSEILSTICPVDQKKVVNLINIWICLKHHLVIISWMNKMHINYLMTGLMKLNFNKDGKTLSMSFDR